MPALCLLCSVLMCWDVFDCNMGVCLCIRNLFDCTMGVCFCAEILECDSCVGVCLCAVCVCVCVFVYVFVCVRM